MTSLWAVEMAEAFWAEAGGAPTAFPRDLRRAIAFALPLAVVDMPRPRVGTVNRWLADRGLDTTVGEGDRPLRACLVVSEPGGIVFLDGADPDDERRFSLAHEVAHYWIEHLARRRELEAQLGSGVGEIFDGARAPTAAERVRALLAGVPFAPRVHLMERDADGWPVAAAVTLAERRADELAVELLAPIEEVTSHVATCQDRDEARVALESRFGLPAPVAEAYAGRLVPERPARQFVDRLRAVSNFRPSARNTE